MTILNQHKSGQATLILVMITMVAVLGVAASSSTQSSINLKNTVYGVQSEQSLGCAEAGAERLLGKYTDQDTPIPNSSVKGDSNGDGSLDAGTDIAAAPLNAAGDSGCAYNAVISNYPDNTGNITIKRLNENVTQQLVVSKNINPVLKTLTPLRPSPNNGELAIYIYTAGANTVTRRLLYCGGGSAPSTGFESHASCNNLGLGAIPAGSLLRFRAVNNDFKMDLTGFVSGGSASPVGYYIQSVGTSGSVRRTAKAYRFYRQLPGFFDEAVVDFN